VTTEEQQATHDPLRPNVKTFKPSTFQLSQFEVVAHGNLVTEFSRDEFPVVQGRPVVVDPMFEVYDDLVVKPQEWSDEESEAESEAYQALASDDQAALFVPDIEIVPPPEEVLSFVDNERGTENSAEADTPETIEEVPATASLVAENLTEEAPVVPLSELELLRQSFEEERLARQAAHDQELEAVRTATRQEVEAHAAHEGEERIRAIEERYRTIIDDMGAQIHQEIEAVERRAVEFSLHVARKLVGTIVEINPEYILQVIKDAVKLTGGATIKAIKVNPQDLEFLKMVSPDRQFKEFDGSWSFQADETIRAGCIVETSSGEVEFNLDKAWERIKESVTKVR
jgi:flagellar biosynthesis/type III secretory pathway protein FliH